MPTTSIDAGDTAADSTVEFSRVAPLALEQLSPETRILNRKNGATFFREVKKHGATNLSDALGISNATLSRVLNDGRAEFTLAMLAVMGLRIVPADARVYIQPEEYQ